jgi:hypothetical protein
MARGGRRRRVLNEEVRTASGLSVTAYQGAGDADAPRYGEQASVEHHPQITDYVPRRKRAVVLTLLAGASVAAGAESLTHFAEPIAAAMPGIAASDLTGQLAGGMTAWASAVSLLLCAMLARLIYSLRRHRVDDYAGRYRVWRWIAWGGMLASINSVVQLHGVVAKIAVAATGMRLTSMGAEWWLAPAALIGGWIFVRLMLEVGESRSSLAMLVLAACSYAAAGAGSLGWSPAALGPWATALTDVMPLIGHTMALAGLMVFGRYVVLDVQGLIEHKPRPAVREPKAAKRAPAPSLKLSSAQTAMDASDSAAAQATTVAEDWSEDGEYDEDDGVGRKLSKADRKRLRKQQRAA